MTFFVCVSLPSFLRQNLNKFCTTIEFRTLKGLRHDALTNAYIPHTTLRDRLSGRVRIDTLLLHIETVFPPNFVFYESWILLKPTLKLCLVLSIWAGIVWRHSLGGSWLNQIDGHQFYHVYISFGFHSRMFRPPSRPSWNYRFFIKAILGKIKVVSLKFLQK